MFSPSSRERKEREKDKKSRSSKEKEGFFVSQSSPKERERESSSLSLVNVKQYYFKKDKDRDSDREKEKEKEDSENEKERKLTRKFSFSKNRKDEMRKEKKDKDKDKTNQIQKTRSLLEGPGFSEKHDEEDATSGSANSGTKLSRESPPPSPSPLNSTTPATSRRASGHQLLPSRSGSVTGIRGDKEEKETERERERERERPEREREKHERDRERSSTRPQSPHIQLPLALLKLRMQEKEKEKGKEKEKDKGKNSPRKVFSPLTSPMSSPQPSSPSSPSPSIHPNTPTSPSLSRHSHHALASTPPSSLPPSPSARALEEASINNTNENSFKTRQRRSSSFLSSLPSVTTLSSSPKSRSSNMMSPHLSPRSPPASSHSPPSSFASPLRRGFSFTPPQSTYFPVPPVPSQFTSLSSSSLSSPNSDKTVNTSSIRPPPARPPPQPPLSPPVSRGTSLSSPRKSSDGSGTLPSPRKKRSDTVGIEPKTLARERDKDHFPHNNSSSSRENHSMYVVTRSPVDHFTKELEKGQKREIKKEKNGKNESHSDESDLENEKDSAKKEKRKENEKEKEREREKEKERGRLKDKTKKTEVLPEGEADLNQIEAISLDKLIELLVLLDDNDKEYVSEFLMTYTAWVTPAELLGLLLDFYRSFENLSFHPSHKMNMQLGVANMIHSWLSQSPNDFADKKMNEEMKKFLSMIGQDSSYLPYCRLNMCSLKISSINSTLHQLHIRSASGKILALTTNQHSATLRNGSNNKAAETRAIDECHNVLISDPIRFGTQLTLAEFFLYLSNSK